MAISSSIRFSLLLILLLLFANASSLRATRYGSVEAHVKKMIDSKRILRELGFDLSKMKHYNRRAMDVDKDRVAPGGPDRQHH